VSGLDTPWDDDEVDASTAAQTLRRQTLCPGHERALPVDVIVKMLDMKEEGKPEYLRHVLIQGHLSSVFTDAQLQARLCCGT